MKIALNVKKGKKTKFKNLSRKKVVIKEEGQSDREIDLLSEKNITAKTKGKKIKQAIRKPVKQPSRRKK
jgi:hypothetical protein